MSNISIGCSPDNGIRVVDLAQAHSIIIAGGNEFLRDNLVNRIFFELTSADVEIVYVYCLEQIEEQITEIETFANEVDERYANESSKNKEKVLIVNDYALITIPLGKKGRAIASRVKRSIEHIAKRGKAVGMHVIIVVGRPCVNVLPISIKNSFLTKICFKTLTGVESFAVINLRKACEIESGQLILCKEYEYEVLNVPLGTPSNI